MPDSTPLLSLPFIKPSQAQKHVTHNEALQSLDILVQLTVEDFNMITPPAVPASDKVYVLGSGATGAWAGQGGKLAAWRDGAWVFVTPLTGWRAWGRIPADIRVFNGSAWQRPPAQQQNLTGIGINAVSDTTNRLSVASTATLLSHEGQGHRLKVNKASATQTASLLFQDNFSGRAELGLTGDDDFHIKVSPNGTTFHEALTVRRDTGFTEANCLMSGQIVIGDGGVGTIDTPSPGGMLLIATTHAEYPQSNHSGVFAYDTGLSPALQTLGLGGGMANEGATVLTGTTGADGKTSISAQIGAILIENRKGWSQAYTYTFIGG